jgi:hypothetical protein
MDKNIRIKISLNLTLLDSFNYSLSCKEYYSHIFLNNDFWRKKLVQDFNIYSIASEETPKEKYKYILTTTYNFKKAYFYICMIGKQLAGHSGLHSLVTSNGTHITREFIQALFIKLKEEYGLDIYDVDIIDKLETNLNYMMIYVNHQDISLQLLNSLIKK